MTTTTTPLTMTARPLVARIGTVVRLLFANPWTAIYTPLLILTVIVLMNLAVWGIVRASIPPEGEMATSVNGGVFFLFVYMLVVAVQTVNQAFPLALGYGSTRRDFLLGFGVFAVVLSIGYAALLATGAVLERATGGWGLGLSFFSIDELWRADWVQGFGFSILAFLLFFGIGAATAAVYVRWKAMGMYVFWAGLVLIGIGGAALVTWLQAWQQVGAFLAAAGVLGSAAWSLIITAFCALAAWVILRRATPSQG
ncbi:ABC transporter permease [Microcella sp.]|uniref:ABC transporter permease n=1 Tax=Microcella sp. TaxID=1913979 RepID=UPI0039188AB9